MRKYGKYEKRPEGVPVKQPKVKSALLQTYFTSLLCMVLCVTMFFGTSYAWFTSEVNVADNQIYIGKLNVDLLMNDVSLKTTNTKVFDKTIHWEPGYTAFRALTVQNEGDLAFRYELTFTPGVETAEAEETLTEAAEWFTVWCYHDANNSAPTPENYGQITEENGWTKIGSLQDVLNGEVVFQGTMTKEEVLAAESKAAHTYTIALHMNGEDAEGKQDELNNLMGQTIGLNVKLVATQLGSEVDGFGTMYDQLVTSGDELANAFQNGGTVVLIEDIALDGEVTMNGGVLDGNGKTIRYTVTKGENDPSLGVVTTSGGTVRNLTVTGENGRAIYVTNLKEDLIVSNCTLAGAYSFNYSSSADSGKSLYFTKTVFKNWTSYANVVEGAFFTDCTFEDVLKPYGSTTLKNCTFTTDGLDISALVNGETIELINCTYNGTSGINMILKAENDQVAVPEGFYMNDDGMLVAN